MVADPSVDDLRRHYTEWIHHHLINGAGVIAAYANGDNAWKLPNAWIIAGFLSINLATLWHSLPGGRHYPSLLAPCYWWQNQQDQADAITDNQAKQKELFVARGSLLPGDRCELLGDDTQPASPRQRSAAVARGIRR